MRRSQHQGRQGTPRKIRPSFSRLWLGAGRWRSAQGLLRRLVKRLPWQQPRETVEQQNAWRLYNEVIWWGVMTGVAGTFLGVYAVRLGASAQLMGLLTALPALVTSLGSIPAGRLVERQRQRVPIILLAAALQRGGYLLVALMPFATFLRQADTLRKVCSEMALKITLKLNPPPGKRKK